LFEERRPSRKKWIALFAVVCVIALAAWGALLYLMPTRRSYIVLREVPVVTYYLKTNTVTTTFARVVASSSSTLSTVTRESLSALGTSTRHDPYVMSWTGTYTHPIVTVVGNSTITQLVRTITNTYAFTTSIPVTYVYGIPTVVTETVTRWSGYNQTVVIVTTMTSTETGTSTYTRTVWTTVTSIPPGLSMYPPPAGSQTETLAPLIFCSAFAAGILILRRRTITVSEKS